MNKKIITIFLVSLFFAVYIPIITAPRVSGDTAISQSYMMTFDWDGRKVRGIVRFVINLSGSGGSIELHKFAQNMNLSQEQLAKYGLPAGTNLDATKQLTISFSPNGEPWVIGSVTKKLFNYYDIPAESGRTQTLRQFSWYKVKDWLQEIIPYKISYSGSLANGSKEFLAGSNDMSGLDVFAPGEILDLGNGIKITYQGKFGTGQLPPSTDYALVWIDGNTYKFVSGSGLESTALQAQNTMGRGPVNIKITNVSGLDDDEVDFGYLIDGTYVGRKKAGYGEDYVTNSVYEGWVFTGGVDGFYTKISQRDETKGSFKWAWKSMNDQRWVTPSKTRVNATITMTYPNWFVPDTAKINLDTETFRQCFDYTNVIDLSSSSFVIPMRVQNDSGAWWGVETISQYWQLDIFGRADTRSEVVGKLGIESMYNAQPTGYYWATNTTDVVGASGISLWTMTEDTALKSTSIQGAPSGSSSGIYDANTNVYAILKGGKLGSPVITLDVPAELFDFAVDIPPYGKPEIVSVNDVEIGSGSSATLKVTVKNIGESTDSFVIESIAGLPSGITWQAGSAIGINKNQTGTVTAIINAGQFTQAFEQTASFVVRAVGSQRTAQGTFKIKGIPEKPPTPLGDVEIKVVDKSDKPMKGVSVRMDSISLGVTNDMGIVKAQGVEVGSYTVELYYGGITKRQGITVYEGQNSYVIRFYETGLAEMNFVPILGILVAIGIIGVGYYYWTKKQTIGTVR